MIRMKSVRKSMQGSKSEMCFHYVHSSMSVSVKIAIKLRAKHDLIYY